MALTCRYYENKYPEIDDVVMVNVRSIADMGAYVHLLEYNNIEGKTKISFIIRIFKEKKCNLGKKSRTVCFKG